MKKYLLLIVAGALYASAAAQTSNVPERVIIISGDTATSGHAENIAVMYDDSNSAFQDPAAPRFLFLDKKGTIALGIGGYMKAEGMYDFDGSIDDNGFVTNQIAVPRGVSGERFGATAAHSTIFLKLVTRPTRLGRVIVYVQTNFTGNNGGYGLKLVQAYASIGHLTLGKARSTFADGPAMAPTIDDQGPSGQVSAKNMLIKYETSIYKGLSAAVSVEMPSASYTMGNNTAAIAQRFPDIPAYIQYAWNKSQSHIRISGILRELSYRNEVAASNHFATGWGVQLSGVSDIAGGLSVFGHYTYGKGITSYINDLSDLDYDLVPDGNGKLKAPAAAGWTAGLQYNFNDDFFVSGAYSQARLYDCSHLGADTYRYGQYVVANAFYNVVPELQLGLEYLHGTRTNIDGQSGKANRVMAMIQYSF